MKYFIALFLIQFFSICTYSQAVNFSRNRDFTYTRFDDLIEDSNSVYRLDLSNQDLEAIPDIVYHLPNLEYLCLNSNNIDTLSKDIAKLQNLKTLRISGNYRLDIFDFFEKISSLQNLEQLDLSNNYLQLIPPSISSLISLRSLNVSNNIITDLPSFSEMENLVHVDLSKNLIKDVNKNTFNENTQFLDLSYNPVIDTSSFFSSLENNIFLDSIGLRGIKKLNEDIIYLKNIKFLDLSESNLSVIPKNFKKFSHLETLIIENPRKTDYIRLFSKLASMKNLYKFILTDNSIANLPIGLGKNKSIEVLQISGKMLKYLPNDLDNISTLYKLQISSSPKIDLKYTLNICKSMDSLDVLSINNCKIDSIPDNIKDLNKVASIDFSDNEIAYISPKINKLQQVDKIDLRRNLLKNDVLGPLKLELPNCDILADYIYVKPETKIRKIEKPIADIKFNTFTQTIKNADTSLMVASGSKITIPKDAFLNKKGEVVTTPVTIKYTEYKSPLEYFLSGIPLEYDSAGFTFNFQSGGMFEFLASDSKGEEVYANPESQIQVDFKSNNVDKRLNLYYFDSITGNWDYISQDTNGLKKVPDSVTNARIARMLIKMPVFQYNIAETPIYMKNPRKNIEKKLEFQLKVDSKLSKYLTQKRNEKLLKNHYEHKALTKVNWIIDQNQSDSLYKELTKLFVRERIIKKRILGIVYYKTILEQHSKILLTDFNFEQNLADDNYKLTFKMLNKKYNLSAYPKNTDKNADKIQKLNTSMIVAYNKGIDRNRKQWIEMDSVYKVRFEEYQVDVAFTNSQNEELRKELLAGLDNAKANEENIIRNFTLFGFGQYNCDIIQRMKNPIPMLAKLINDKNKEVSSTVHIIDYSNNGVYSYYKGTVPYFEGGARTSLIACLPNDEIGYICAKDMVKYGIYENKSQLVHLTIIDSKNTTIEALRKQIE